MKSILRRLFYRPLMRLAHRHGWHHVTTSHLEDGSVQHWCQWCGLRETLRRDTFAGMKLVVDYRCPKNTILITNIGTPR
jgi:hypothetical protein